MNTIAEANAALDVARDRATKRVTELEIFESLRYFEPSLPRDENRDYHGKWNGLSIQASILSAVVLRGDTEILRIERDIGDKPRCHTLHDGPWLDELAQAARAFAVEAIERNRQKRFQSAVA